MAPDAKQVPDKAHLEEALHAHEWNVAATARDLGTHRTQLRRWMEYLGLRRP